MSARSCPRPIASLARAGRSSSSSAHSSSRSGTSPSGSSSVSSWHDVHLLGVEMKTIYFIFFHSLCLMNAKKRFQS